MKKSNLSVFVNTSIKTTINDNLSVVGNFQVIVYQAKNGGYDYDIEPLDLVEINMFGTKIDSNVDEAARFLRDNINIDSWGELTDTMEEIIMYSGSIVDWVFEETGLKLPVNEVLAN